MPKGVLYPGAGIGKALGKDSIINKRPNPLSATLVRSSPKETALSAYSVRMDFNAFDKVFLSLSDFASMLRLIGNDSEYVA